MTATYHCLLCQRIIREFGEDELPHFPRQHIRCPHCATSYREKANGKIELRTERRDILRLAYWKLTGSVPKVLQEREPFFGFVIADVDDAFLWEEQTVLDSSEPSFWLSVRGQSVPLDHVHWVFFSGTEQQELEEQLHALAEQAPERFTYSLARTRQKLRTVLSEEDKHEASPSVSSFLTNISSPRSLISSPHSSQDRSSSSSQSPPSTDKQNSTDARLQQYQLVFHGLAQTGCLNNAFLRARQLSNFGAMLTLRQEDLVALEKNDRLPSPFLSEEQEHPSLGLPWRYDWQLLAMVNSLLRASAGVTSDYYALQLEGQNNKWFFELVKATGRTAGCESWGRVASRFVQDRFQSYGPGQAYSELDAFINYFTRLIRELLDPLFVAVGLEPEELGAGLFHHRRSRSDLEKLGAYFDLIDPVRALVLRALVYGIQKGLSFRDLVFVLGSGGREQYRVRWDALKKFELLLYWALGQPVVWQGKEQPFYRAYQAYLQSVKAFLDRCVERLAAFKCNFKECVVAARLSGLEVLDPKTWQGLPPEEQEELRRRLSALFRKVCREVSFQPFIFCPTGQRRRLTRVAQFAANWQQLFTGGEERVLERKRVRETFRAAAMQDWSTEEAPHTAALHRLTKYQRRERARTLTVALFLVYWVYRTGDWSRWYSTKFFQKALNLTQNRAYRLLKRMVQRGFLQTIRTPLTRVYRLAFTHPAVRELLQALDYERTKGLENGTTAVLASCSTASTDLAACHEPARPVDEPSEPSLQVVRLGMNLRTFPEKLAQAHQESYLVGATAEGSLAAILYRVKTEQLWEKWTVPAALQEALDWLKEFLGIDKEAP